eukprot:TRINITY_DN4385_c3_g2_i1.p1 TRINITY_DN4385_c3_g2~~TRINITY_DN4385_c3_g2_i1.p1  ORF type:complete len:521 (+),score=112.82 TRINITY_DN4385_c3_g2_i1:73-1563(+)
MPECPVPHIRMDIPQNKVKIVAKVVACMAKINDDFFIEPSKNGCVFRAVNSLRTVHMAVTFGKGFFSDIMIDDSMERLTEPEINLRLSTKYVGAVFKSQSTITSIRMETLEKSDRLIFRCNTTYEGIVKTYSLNFSQELSDKAEADAMTSCRFRAKPGQLSEACNNVSHKCENIQLMPADQRLSLSTDTLAVERVGGTSISLSVNDLIAYEYDGEIGIKIFEQRYFRSFLSLADGCGLDSVISFDGDRAPVLLEFEGVDVDPQSREPHFKAAMLVSAWEADPPEDPAANTQMIKVTPHQGTPQPSIQSCKTTKDTPGGVRISGVPQQHPTGGNNVPTTRTPLGTAVGVDPSPTRYLNMSDTSVQSVQLVAQTPFSEPLNKRPKLEPVSSPVPSPMHAGVPSPVQQMQMQPSPVQQMQQPSPAQMQMQPSPMQQMQQPSPMQHAQQPSPSASNPAWQPERYPTQVDVSQYTTQPGGYRLANDEEEFLEASVSPPRYE